MSIILNTDFDNEFKVSETNFTDLDSYITRYEKSYLIKLMGVTMYDAYIADLNAAVPQVPTDADLLLIHNPINDDSNGCLLQSEGLRLMIVQFVYFHYMRDLAFQSTAAGAVRAQFENSVNLGYQGYNLVEVYNRAIANYQEIQRFIAYNIENYEDYKMTNLYTITGI